MKLALSIAIFTGALLVSGGAYLHSQQANYNLSEVQKLRLTSRQKDAMVLQMQFNQVQAELQKRMQAYVDECNKVKSENHLPNTSVCDINNPETISAPPAPKPEEKKK